MTIQQHIPCEAPTFTLISCTRPAAASLVGKRNASVHRHVATYKPARCTVSARYLTPGYSDCDPATFALQIITHQIHIFLDTLLNDQGSSSILCHQTSVLDKQYRTTTHAISSSATNADQVSFAYSFIQHAEHRDIVNPSLHTRTRTSTSTTFKIQRFHIISTYVRIFERTYVVIYPARLMLIRIPIFACPKTMFFKHHSKTTRRQIDAVSQCFNHIRMRIV